jgi:hypothetical protein
VSAPFVAQLRTSRSPVVLAEGVGSFTVRVEASDIWETVRVTVRPDTSVADLRKRVVAELFPEGTLEDEFVLKFRGWELLDTRASLEVAGIGNGAIVLLAYRRRRPVR